MVNIVVIGEKMRNTSKVGKPSSIGLPKDSGDPKTLNNSLG